VNTDSDTISTDVYKIYPNIDPFDMNEENSFRNYRRAQNKYIEHYKYFLKDSDTKNDLNIFRDILPFTKEISNKNTYFLDSDRRYEFTDNQQINNILNRLSVTPISNTSLLQDGTLYTLNEFIDYVLDKIVDAIDGHNSFTASLFASVSDQIN
jgi:hypothetical protein